MKKNSFLLFLCLFFCKTGLYVQRIIEVQDNNFYTWKNDTLIFNIHGYDWVKKVSKEGENTYVTNVYRLMTPEKLKKDYISHTSFKVSKKFYNKNNDYRNNLYSQYTWKKKKDARHKTILFTDSHYKGLASYLEECSLVMPMMHRDTTQKTLELDYTIFPGLEKIIDAFTLLLFFDHSNTYYVKITPDLEKKVSIRSFTFCNPESYSTQKILTAKELEDTLENMLASYRFPIFKIHNQVFRYYIDIDINSYSYVMEKLTKEKSISYTQSQQVFKNNAPLLAFRDSFYNRTFFYLKDTAEEEKYYGMHYTAYGLDVLDRNRVDINADGKADLVIDSFVLGNGGPNGSYNRISYIPDFSEKKMFGHQMLQTLDYQKELGSGFYYYTSTSGSRIFSFKEGKEKDVVSIKKESFYNPRTHKRNSHYVIYVQDNPELSTKIPLYGKKSEKTKQRLLQLIESYLDHPEKLPIDFPTIK